MTATDTIARFLASVAETAPAEARHSAKRVLLNGLRAALAASGEDLPRRLIDAERARIGTGGGTGGVLFSETRLPVEEAVASNTLLWTLLLIDDLDLPSGIHPGGPATCTALPIAAAARAHGSQLLAAVVAGMEVQMAAARAASPEMLQQRGFAPLAVIAPLGSVAAAVTLAQPGEVVSRAAVGIASMAGCGVWEMGGTASSLFLAGHTTRMGVAALRAATLGVDAPDGAYDGEFGAFRAYSGKPVEVLHEHLAGLGRDWLSPTVTLQPYSGDTYSQAPLECIRALRKRVFDAPLAALESIEVDVSARVALGVERKHRRHSTIESPLLLNSDPMSRLAAAWLRGEYSYSTAFATLIADREVAELRERVRFRADLSLADMGSAAVTLRFADGHIERAAVDAFPGSTRCPISDDGLSSWFRAVAAPLLPEPRIGRILDSVWHLEDDGAVAVLADAVFAGLG